MARAVQDLYPKERLYLFILQRVWTPLWSLWTKLNLDPQSLMWPSLISMGTFSWGHTCSRNTLRCIQNSRSRCYSEQAKFWSSNLVPSGLDPEQKATCICKRQWRNKSNKYLAGKSDSLKLPETCRIKMLWVRSSSLYRVNIGEHRMPQWKHSSNR